LGWVSAIDCEGRTIWIADAHRDDGKRFVVHADEKLMAFVELESVDSARELALKRGRRLKKNRERGMDSSNLIEPALFYRRRSIENAMPFAVRITARLIVGMMWVVSSSDFHRTCLEPIIRRDEAKEDARHATKQ
jgi:hypothetical protein